MPVHFTIILESLGIDPWKLSCSEKIASNCATMSESISAKFIRSESSSPFGKKVNRYSVTDFSKPFWFTSGRDARAP